MNGPYRSVYGEIVEDYTSPQPEERNPSPTPLVIPPKAAPRTTVTRPVTVATLREAKAAQTAAQRVPITQRIREPEVPARQRLKKKTVAFGVTTNVSQTVERDKATPPLDRSSLPAHRPPLVLPPSRMSLGRVGVAAERTPLGTTMTRPLTTAAARLPAAAAAVPSPSLPVGDENRPPARGESMGEERKDTARLETRIAELEKRERQQGEKHKELQFQFDKVVKIVTTLTQRVAELEVDMGGDERKKGGGGRRERSSGEDEDTRTRRRLYSPDGEGGGREGGGEGRREQQRGGGRERRSGGGGMLDSDALRALERQLSANPLLRHQIEDALAQDKYEHEYGEGSRAGGRRTTSPQMRRAPYADEFDDPPPLPRVDRIGRCPASAPNQRWKEETRSRPRLTPPRAGGGGGGRGMGMGGGGMTRKRSDITPSRRRVTERVTMERVHHWDDESDDSDGVVGGGYERFTRYDSDEPQPYPCTQFSEEVVEDIHSAVAPQNGRRGYGQQTHRNQQQHAAPLITEVSDSEDALDRKRRERRERLEARGGRK